MYHKFNYGLFHNIATNPFQTAEVEEEEGSRPAGAEEGSRQMGVEAVTGERSKQEAVGVSMAELESSGVTWDGSTIRMLIEEEEGRNLFTEPTSGNNTAKDTTTIEAIRMQKIAAIGTPIIAVIGTTIIVIISTPIIGVISLTPIITNTITEVKSKITWGKIMNRWVIVLEARGDEEIEEGEVTGVREGIRPVLINSFYNK